MPACVFPGHGTPRHVSSAVLPANRNGETSCSASLKFVSFNTHGGPVSFGANDAPGGDELERADAIQPRRPVHAQFHGTSERQFVFRGEEDSAATNIQRGAAPAYLGRPSVYYAVTNVLADGKPVSTPAIREPSDGSTVTVCAAGHGLYHVAFRDAAQ